MGSRWLAGCTGESSRTLSLLSVFPGSRSVTQGVLVSSAPCSWKVVPPTLDDGVGGRDEGVWMCVHVGKCVCSLSHV